MKRKGFLRLLGMGGLGASLPFYSKSAIRPINVIKPKRLEKGDVIGLTSPSSRLPEPDQYNTIIKTIRDLGYRVKVGENARNTYGYLAGTDRERAADFNTMFADDTVSAIMPFRGGWGANRILDLIDYDLIRNNPKILVGFSDISALLLSVYHKTGLITFHGPVGKSDWNQYTTGHFEKILSGFAQKTIKTAPDGKCDSCDLQSTIVPGTVKGRLLGGNLSVLTSMMGSDYLPEWEENILFLEDVGEDIYRIDRMLTQLKLNGVLDKISGFVFGQCTECTKSNSYSLSLQQLFEDHIKPLGIPAFSGAMIGHISKMLTLPIGLPVEMNARRGTIKMLESPVIQSGK